MQLLCTVLPRIDVLSYLCFLWWNLIFFSCFQVPGGSFPCLQRVCCKPEAHIRIGSSNPIDKQVGLTSSCEPGVSVFSEAGGLFSLTPGPLFSLLPHCSRFILTKVEAVLWASLLGYCIAFFPPTGHVESDCSLFTSALRHARGSKAILAHDLVHIWF